MFKKYLLAAVFYIFSSVSFAATPYVGFQLSLNNANWNLQNSQSGTTHFSGTGEAISLFAGLTTQLAPAISLASEAFFTDMSTRTGTRALDNNGLSAKLRSNFSYGLSVLPGYLLSADTSLYVRLGVIRTRFELTTTPAGSAVDTATGGQAGVGLALALSKNLDLRGEYAYSLYQNYNAESYNVNPSASQLSVAFVYKII